MTSDRALAFIELVSDKRAFPDEAARDLMRLLGHTLAEPHFAARRWDTLGCLTTLIRLAGGRLPTVREYDAFRGSEALSAPAGSTLTERYGSWISALTAASRLLDLSLRTPVSPYKLPRHRPYTPGECLAALAQFRKRFGEWPRSTEYRAWATSTRRAAQVCGASDPSLPDLKVILRRFGTYDRALKAANEIYGRDR